MEGGRGPVVLLLLPAVVLLVLAGHATGRYLRFDPGFEYQYKYYSNAQLHRVDKFVMEARVSYTCIRELEEGQEIRLQVIACSLKAGKGQSVPTHRWNFSKWFSFVLTPRGEIIDVQYAAGEDEETLAIKKGLAALLAARLHHHSDQADVKVYRDGGDWRYDVQELGHEGLHNATYHVTPSQQGTIFTKQRHNHPLAHAVGAYTKTMHYHDSLQMFHTVEINEHFDAMADPPEGYSPYIPGHDKPKKEEEQAPLPSMTGEGKGRLQFLTKIHLKDTTTLERPDVPMVTSTIHVDKVRKDPGPRKNLTEVTSFILGNLTCMRRQPEPEGTKALQECFHALVHVMTFLRDSDVSTVTYDYLGPGARVRHLQSDRKHMVDAVWAIATEHAQNEVTKAVLLTPEPIPAFVERLLYLIGGGDELPSEFVIRTIVSMVFKPQQQARAFHYGDLRHRIILVLGTLIRRMHEQGDLERASALATRLQDMLGVHDAFEFRRKRATMVEAQMIQDDLWKVVLLESLGNARMDQSYGHIVSHVNDTNSQWVKRAAIHALRDYHHDHAANVILMAAMYDEHETVRYESLNEYQRHPRARVLPKSSDRYNTTNFSEDSVVDVSELEESSHSRRERDLFDDWAIKLESPSVKWQKILGSKKIGASFGLTIKNMLDIKIGMLAGHTIVDIHDEAYGQVNLGFMGINVDILRLRLCFRGHAKYNLNLLQEFDVKQIERTAQMFDKMKKKTVDAISDGIQLFRDLLEGNTPIADIIQAFVNAIKKLPEKIITVGMRVYAALEKISQYDDKELPPFIVPLKNLVLKVSNLVNDIKTDVIGFCNRLMTATVVIPCGGKQIFESVENIIESFENIQKDPLGAIQTVTSSTLTIGVQVKFMVDAVKDVKEAAFFLKKEKPYWWDLRGQSRILMNMSHEVVRAIEVEGPKWVKTTIKGANDKIDRFTRGNMTMAQMKGNITKSLKALPEIVNILFPLENLGDDIQTACVDLFELVVRTKKAYVRLKTGARYAKQFIEKVFGPKAHKRFPRETRTPGGNCQGKGFYPGKLQSTESNTPEYKYDGVDVLIPDGWDVVAPFPGIIYLSDKKDEVIIQSRGSPKGVDFIISNVRANASVRALTDPLFSNQEVVAGQVIGQSVKSPCTDRNHIHFAIRKGSKTVDPTRFLQSRWPTIPFWKQLCDDYKYVYKARTLAAGTIVGLMGRKNNNTSPPRTPDPAIPPSLLATGNPKTKIDQEVKKPNSVAQNVTDNKAQATQAATTSNDSLMKTLFKSALTFLRKFNLKDVKLGALAKFLNVLKMQESLNNMTTVFRTIQDMVSNKPCKNPHSMSNKAIRAALRAQGKLFNGSRHAILKRYLARSDKCPMLSLGLPTEMYCVIDDQCLGLECCLDIKVMFFRKTYKMYARYDPCNTSLVIGMQEPFKKFEKTFGPEYGLDDIIGGFDETLSTGIKFDMMSAELYVRVVMEKEDKGAVLSFDAKFCKTGDPDDCLITLKVLNRAVMPVPVCGPDGTVYAPTVDLKTVLKNQKDKFQPKGKKTLTDAVEEMADKAVEYIPCLGSQDDSGNLPCARPDAMSEETLTQALEARGLSTSGTAQERVDRLEQDDRTCTVALSGTTLTLPTISDPDLAQKVYVKVTPDCLGIEACVDIPLGASANGLNYSRSVRASMALDTCMPVFNVGFESCNYEVLLFNTTMGFSKDFRLSDLYTLQSSIAKAETDSSYTVGLGLKIQLESGGTPYVDALMIDGFQIPIPVCSDYALPGNGSLTEIATITRNTLTAPAVRFYLKTLKLDTVLTEGSCSAMTSSSNCPWNIDLSGLPSNITDLLTCGMTYNCLGITCCLDVEVNLPFMTQPLEYYLPFHLTFDPCDNMKVDMSFGSYTRLEQLLNYDFGQARLVNIGVGQYAGDPSPLNVTFSVDHYRTMDPYDEGFELDLHINLCIPFDGQNFCILDDHGIDVMLNQKVPVCSPVSHAEITNFNLTAFLEETGQAVNTQSLPQSVSQMLLNKFGITDNMKEFRCDRQRAPYSPALDGWRNECPEPTQQLPKLPQDAVCYLSSACNRVDCCLYSEFLDMNINAWFELNCDLYLQAGLERMVSPRQYVLGGEIDWNQGISGEVNISEAFKIEYAIRKDSMSYIIDADIKLCFDGINGDCQLVVNVMTDTKIPNLGCNPSAVSYFNDLFTWQQCVLPDGETGCHVSLPTSLEGKCVQTNNCLGIQCCLPVDLGFLGEYSVDARFDFDRCANTFVYSLDQKSGSLGLAAIVDVPQSEAIGSAITFNYQVKSALNGYDLEASLDVCALDNLTSSVIKCATYDILPDDVSIYSPSSHCTGRRRKRSVVKPKPKYDCANSPLSKNDLMLHMIEKENATVADLEKCMSVFKKRANSKCNTLKNQTSSHTSLYSPKGILGGLGTKNPSSLMFCSKHALFTVEIEGANIIAAMLSARPLKGEAGRKQQPFVPGGGLTEQGNKALATKIANMTIAQMQAYVLSEGVDPEQILHFLTDMKDVLQTLYCDVITSITESSLEDLFKSFDLSLTGDFSVPRQTTNFFEYKQFFLVGGLVPMTFEFSAGITTSMKVIVNAKMLKLVVAGTVAPYVTLRVQGTLSVGALLLGQLRLTGYICQLSLPSTATIDFSKFPMDVSLTIDLDLKPLELKLAALVTLEINLVFETIIKELFKTNLFQYETPTISKRVLHVGKNEPDKSPPKFDNFGLDKPAAGRRRRSQGTDSCYVKQLEGLDYTEPAIEIGVTATDDKSKPLLMVYAGTKPGLQDLLASEMGGSSTVIRERLSASAQPVYFTVKATNSGGASKEVTCSINTYDVTLPTGRLEAEFSTSSNQHVLHGKLVVYEDSVLTTSDLGVGLGKGMYAGGVRAWEPVNLNDRGADSYDAASDQAGHVALENHFTDFKEGRLSVPTHLVTQNTQALFLADCAKKCMMLSPQKCMSFNFHSKGHCELMEAIEGHDHEVSVATNYLHFERLGVGLAHEFKLDVPMVHNSLYFLNLFMENELQFINTISSEGTLIDLTPPLPGPINITRDVYEIVPCADNIPSDRSADWMKWCRGMDPALPNHRIIHDGINSATIFNGHERMHDLLYTKANKYVSANWDGIHDYESGILGFTLTVGKEICEEWLHPHHDPHKHLVPIDDDSQWTHIGVVNTPNGISLPDRKYYVTLRALNEVQYGGPLSTSFCHAIAYGIDTSPPLVYEVYGTTYDEETHVITTKYNASDPHSDILDAALCLGRSVLNCDLKGWEVANTSSTTEGPAFITYQIGDGVPAWVRLRAENGVELQAIGHALHPIIVDMSPPLPGTVYDGPVSKQDLEFSKDQLQYCANWFNFTDPDSGIAYYMGAVLGEDGTPLTNLTLLDRRSHVTCMGFTNPPLQHNNTYRFLLYAFNAGHKQLNVSAESDGVLVDLTPPETGDVIDGMRDNFQDISFSVHKATVGAQWRNFRDPESGIIYYEVQVERAENMSSNFQVIQTWDNVALASTYEKHTFQLQHRDVIKTSIRATNGALNSASLDTDSFIMDMTPPDLISLWDGLGSADIDFQTDVDHLDASFEFVDDESGVDHYKYQVYQTQYGHRTQIVPPTRNRWVELSSGPRTSITVSSLSLTPGIKYSLRIAAVNHAGSVATYDTNGVVIDPTPPSMDYVHVGVLSSEDEVLINGYVLQNDRSGIKATWLATDHESGVSAYEVSVGTSSGGTDVLSWRNMGGERDGYIGGLSLQLTDSVTQLPVYYVSVRAINGAGAVSSSITSNRIKILEEDEAGIVTDGGKDTVLMTTVGLTDRDYQLDKWSVTAQFSGYTSHLHGMARFDWAVGTSPGGEEVMPFTVLGILHDETETGVVGNGIASRGVAQTVLPLQPDTKYYTTVRAFNNDGQAVQSVSDGFTVDNSQPDLAFISLSKEINASVLVPDTVLYQGEADALSAEWTYSDSSSQVVSLRYSVGTFPGAEDIVAVTEADVTTGDGGLPSTAVYLNTAGRPNIVTLWAENSVGLSTEVVSSSVIVDITAPGTGVVTCPLFVQPHSQAVCKWTGFEDAESPIDTFTFFIGTSPGLYDVVSPVTLEGYVTSYPSVLSSLSHNMKVYATVVATNALGLNTSATSSPIAMDSTPPVPGVVVELSDKYIVIAGEDNDTLSANNLTCATEDECLAFDVTCQESLTSVFVAWSPFEDPETSITKYEVAVGTSAGGGQLRKLEEVPSGQNYYLVQGLSLMGEKKIYVTVKATNGAGASTTATSNGVHMSYLSQGLTPPGTVYVWDGSSMDGDLDFQTSVTSISARWTIEGDACPAVRYEWAIERVDGHLMYDYYDTNGKTTALNDALLLTNLELYYQLVRVTNALGYVYTLRSDGITVNQDPLIPGEVFDGSKTGFDLNYLADFTKVSANWQGFGDVAAVSDLQDDTVEQVESNAIVEGKTGNQEVRMYEVALGTDRTTDTTRDNIVPWTNVGLNTSVTFYDLDLTPLTATYYFSVRAYSTSNSRAEITSNGFRVGFDNGVTHGRIEIQEYLGSNSTMQVSWDSFSSVVGMFIYYVALSSQPVDNSTCGIYTDGGSMSDARRQAEFDISDRVSAGDQTFAVLENLTMTHDTDVYVHVIGVDRAGMCRMITEIVHIDVTPPVAGQVKVGPYYNTSLTFAPDPLELTVDWENFDDAESPITSYTLELMTQPACDVNTPPGGNVLMTVEIGFNYSSYTLRLGEEGQSLFSGQPYYVKVNALNLAGLNTSVISPPFVYDDSTPVGGHVVDGTNFQVDDTWAGSNSTISASILHLATPLGPACPSRLLPFAGSSWTKHTADYTFDSSGRQLDLRTQPRKVALLNDTAATITLTRDTNKGWMYTGTVLTTADFVRGGAYEMNIQAANGDGNAVTSVTLWDGTSDDVIHYDFTFVVEEEYCMCCFDSVHATAGSDCMMACGNCTEYIWDYNNRTSQNFANVTRRRRSAGVQSLSAAELQRLQNGDTLATVNADAAFREMPACGLQIYTLNSSDPDYINGSLGRVVVWCVFGEDTNYEPKFASQSVTFDPSAEPHHYKLEIDEQADEAAQPTSCLSVYIDHDTVFTAELCGIPDLSSSTQLALSVWNWKNFLTDPSVNSTSIALWQASATFNNVYIPATTTSECRYGDPFRGGQNPIVGYEAGIGSDVGLDDVVPFVEVYTPCFPCVHNCDHYSCDSSCDGNVTLPLTFTLSGLDLPSVANLSSEEYVPSVYYFSVKAVLGSGLYTVVSSNGFSIDVTPPIPDPSTFFYLDAAQGESKPVEHLFASNSTIQAVYRCNDNESDIMEYEWAIGTTPGGQEVQNYISTGLNPTGKNDQLFGVITHNTRYYVSFRCKNGAGLVTTYEEQTGVLAFIDALTVSDVGGSIENTSPIGNNVVPATARQSSSSDSVAMQLTISADPTIDLYYFSIGSTSDTSAKTDDIFPRTAVAHDMSGEISIHSGNIYKDGTLMFPLAGLRDGYNGTGTGITSSSSDFQLEPGREIFAFVDSCNEAMCTGPVLMGSVLVVTANSFAAVSDGTALHVGLTAAARGKRSVDAVSHSHSRVRRSADNIFVETPSGLQVGQTIVVTELTDAELTASYDSVASTSFVSYLTDPTYTLNSVDTVDRILVGRASYNSATDVAFSLSSVGQVEMPGPVKVTYQYNPSDPDNTVLLLHWNPDEQKWQLSSDTCENEADTMVQDPVTSTVTVKVCDTYGASTYFMEQTLFLLPTVSNTITNNPPQMTSATTASMLEDEGTLVYQVETSDAEQDVILVSLQSPALSPDEGDISLTPTNLVLFTPCADCSGVYEMHLVLTEQAVTGITPNTVSTSVTITVTAVNDPPTAFAFRNGSSILSADPAADIVVLLEQNRDNQTADTTYTFVFGAYDVDIPSNLTITIEGPNYGALSVSTENSTVPDCSASVDIQDDTIPCYNMTLPYSANSLSWRYLTLTYRPDNYTWGYDYLRLLATDEGGLGSFVTSVKFAVMEQPCEHGGTCVAKDSSYTCHNTLRAEWFDRYYICNCTAGYEGLHCDGDTDDCAGSPCEYPYVCVDLVNSYSCQCSSHNSGCDGLEGWMIGVIVCGCVLFIILIVLILLVWAVRTGRITLCGTKDKEQNLKIVDSDKGQDNRGYEEDDNSPRKKVKSWLFLTPPKMASGPPVHQAIQKKMSAASLASSSSGQDKASPRSSVSSSGYSSADNKPFRPASNNEPRPNTQLLNSLQYPSQKEGAAGPSVQGLTQGLVLRPRHINTNTMPPLPAQTPVDYRSPSQVSVYVNTPNGRQKMRQDSMRRTSSDSTIIGSEPATPRPITPVEVQENPFDP